MNLKSTRSSHFTLVLMTIACFNMFGAQKLAYTELSEGWQLCSIEPREALTSNFLTENSNLEWMAINKMPAMVHDILQQNAIVKTLWLPGELEKNQWISKKDWLYKVNFSLKNFENQTWLNLMGIDGILDVYLNGRKIASHQNMYTPLRVDLTSNLKEENELILHFHTVYDSQSDDAAPIKIYNNKAVRRPGQNYINYLGPNPCLSKVGVFQSITLVQPNGAEITDFSARTNLSQDYSVGKIHFTAEGQTNEANIQLETTILSPDGQMINKETFTPSISNNHFAETLLVSIEKPQLWFPRGYGEQPLYKMQLTLLIDGKVHHILNKTIAFRDLCMDELLHFKVNGKNVRLWGGDWVTMKSHTAVWDQQRAEALFDLAENANFNTFRVWGVIEPPHDNFYELADARGFMLWQDFTNLPLGEDKQSIATCLEESKLMVNRLKNHPSIFVWCGGNENAMWFHPEYNNNLEDRGEWKGTVATDAIAAQLKTLDPDRYFQPSSPYYGIDPNDPQKGNTHGYTNMWFVPGYDFMNFASEDTRIAAPTLSSVQKFMAPEDIYPEGYTDIRTPNNTMPFPKTWMKYTTSVSWKKTGPVEQFYDATDATSLIHKIGMAEALYYQQTVEQQRRGRPGYDASNTRKCGGYIVWKYNDSWPQIYSAKVDYFLEPYHAYYALKRAYQPVMVSIEKDNYLYVWAVNDSKEKVEGTMTIEAFHMDQNKVRKHITFPVNLNPDQSKVIVRLDSVGIGSLRKEHVIFAQLTNNSGKVLATNTSLLDIERNLIFPDAKIQMAEKDGYLTLKTDKYAHCITLEGNDNGDKLNWLFEDNYFNLLPGEEKTVRILGKHRQGTISAKAWYSSQKSEIAWTKNKIK